MAGRVEGGRASKLCINYVSRILWRTFKFDSKVGINAIWLAWPAQPLLKTLNQI